MAGDGIRGNKSGPGASGIATLMVGGVPLTFGAERSDTQGSPASPSLMLRYPGMWRFRWAVRSGVRSIQISVMQVSTVRPTLVVKANAGIGIVADVTGTAPAGASWVVVGPVTVTATSSGVVWVELHNNTAQLANPCWWDHIVTQ